MAELLSVLQETSDGVANIIVRNDWTGDPLIVLGFISI
jgi:hypothetical protein